MPESDELSAALRVAPAGLDGRTLCAAGLVASADAERVLDIGCKSGWLLRHLAQQPRRPGVIVGIDLELNDEAARGRSGFELTRADARRLPFDDASFDRLEDVVAWFDEVRLDVVLTETRGGWADVVGLPLLYAATRLRMPVPSARRLARWATAEYSRPGRYTHFVVGAAAR